MDRIYIVFGGKIRGRVQHARKESANESGRRTPAEKPSPR